MAADEDRPREARPFWSGTITFGLVSVPVDLVPGHRTRRASMRMLGPDGTPLRRRYVCSRDDEPVEGGEIIRGYPTGDQGYVVITDEELDRLQPDRSREIDLTRFVPRESVDPFLCNRPYFLMPTGEVTKAYRLLAAVMERTGRAGLASFVMRGTSYLVAIFADKGVLRAETLRYADELRTPGDVGLPDAEKPAADLVKRFRKAITARAEDEADPDELRDEDSAALRAVAERKAKQNQDVVAPSKVADEIDTEPDDNVLDIMAALKKSLGLTEAGNGEKKERKAQRSNGDDLSGMSKKELYALAQSRDIEGRSQMSKEELVEALRAA